MVKPKDGPQGFYFLLLYHIEQRCSPVEIAYYVMH